MTYLNNKNKYVGIGNEYFNITMDSNFFNNIQITTPSIKQYFIHVIRNILGIYSSYDVKVLSDPIQVSNGFKYKVAILAENKHIFWIKYKTIKLI